jgi:hypothetical protein
MNLEIMTVSENLLGVVFRFRDQFNYYAFLLNQKVGYKRLIRVSNGKYKKLAELKDGGLFQGEWFKVQINLVSANIKVRFGQSKNHEKYSELPIVFNIDDFELRQGTIGFVVNNNNKFFFDNLFIKPKHCWTEWAAHNKVEVIPARASIFEEDYRGELEKK